MSTERAAAMSGGLANDERGTTETTVAEGLPFPSLDAFLGVDSHDFFTTDWQRNARLFPNEIGPARLASIGFDFRAAVAAAGEQSRLEALGGQGRTGPGPKEEGWPLVPDAASARVTRVQDFCPPLAALCASLTEELSHRVSVNLYVSPPQSQGLDRHQDGHDVFVLQIEGNKKWKIWNNDAPPPLDSFPALTFEGQKRLRRDYRGTPYGGRGVSVKEIEGRNELRLVLEPGQLLYVPRGWAHEVWTEESHSAHLTFGVHLASWVDLMLTMVSQASRNHAALRAGLPMGFARISPDLNAIAARARDVAALVTEASGAEAMEELIGRWLHRDLDQAPIDAAPESLPEIGPDTRFRRVGRAAVVRRADMVGLVRSGNIAAQIWMPKAFAPAFHFAATTEPPEFAVRDLPGVSISSKARLCGMLLKGGYIAAVSDTEGAS